MANSERSASVNSLSPVPPEQHNCSMDSLIVSDSSEDILEAEEQEQVRNDHEDYSNKKPQVVTENTPVLGNEEKHPEPVSKKKKDKKRKSRERKISISAGPTNMIAGVEMEVLKEGYIMQQGSFQRLVKKYITITCDRLYIAKNNEDKVHEEVILKDVKVAENSSRNVNNSFTVFTPFQQLSLATGTRKEMEEWITAFKLADSKSKHTAVLEAIQHLEGQHSWFACSHPRPTYCNVCREQLHGVAWHGLSCEVCKFKSHRRCVVSVKTPCKWTTRGSLMAAGIYSEQDFSISHEWIEGNLPAGSKCAVCERACGTLRRLKDFRCLWCKLTVHTECRDQMEPICTLGEHKLSILPPSALQRSDAIREGMWEPYKVYGHSPVLALVNSKSGDNQGVKFLRRLKYWLNPAQVFDLAISGPDLGLQLFQRFEKFRVIVLGGDGSIGWVLSAIDKYNLHSKCMVGVVPLGTGNDMARVLGWGSQATDEDKIPQILAEMEQSSFKLLDRWSIHYSSEQNVDISYLLTSPSSSLKSHSSTALSPRFSSTASTPQVQLVAPFPAPTVAIRDAVSPSSDSVFSHNSVSSNGSNEDSQASPEATEHAQKNKVTTEHAQKNGETSLQSVDVEITDNRIKDAGLTMRTSEDDVIDNRERGVVTSSPGDMAKIEAFHDSISELATHFTTILFSESGEEVMSSSQVLGEVVTNFLGSIVAGAEGQLPSTEFQTEPVVQKCIILQDKLNALLANLRNESRPEQEKTEGKVFVAREAAMARANSLKKALRGVLDVTGKALDDSTEQVLPLSMVAEEESSHRSSDFVSSPDGIESHDGIESQSRSDSVSPLKPAGANKCMLLQIPRKPITSQGSVVELSPGIPTMKELQCMNNYFGIGFGAHVAYQFNSAREKHPEQFKSRAKNKLMYGFFGGKELFLNSQRYLERRIQLECDGEVIKLPQRLQGLVLLNIPSYMAGTNFWGTDKEKDGFCAPSHDDKLMEVVGISGFSHLATTKVLGIQNQRLAQCRVAKIVLLGPDKVPMQVDGEAWLQEAGTIVVSHKNKARMIVKDKAFSQSLEQWRQKSTHQLSATPPLPHTHNVFSTMHEVLSSEQIAKYKEVAMSVKPLLSCITSESLVSTTVNSDLLPYVSNVSISLKRILRDDQLSDTADISHLQDFEQDTKALIQETLWFLNMQKISSSNEEEMRTLVCDVESKMKRIVSTDLSECSVAHHNFRRASDTLLLKTRITDQERTPHRQRSKLIPDVTIQAVTIAKKIGKEVCDWDSDDVCEWLEELEMTEYCQNFREKTANGKQLLKLTKSDLQAFGVSKIGHVTRLWQALQALASDSPPLSRVRDSIM